VDEDGKLPMKGGGSSGMAGCSRPNTGLLQLTQPYVAILGRRLDAAARIRMHVHRAGIADHGIGVTAFAKH
jgi:hypothetical protein